MGASPAVKDLPEKLTLHWKRRLPEPRRAWFAQLDDRDKLEFDLSYAPVVAGKKMFIASMRDDSLRAYDLDQGSELWCFFADGPLRLSPSVWQDKVYVVSDDGSLYCIEAESGSLCWKFFAAPGSHLVLGNRRLISLWPARGAPLVLDGRVYFASGIWPFLGTGIFALDAQSGAVIWQNNGHSTQWQPQPHGGAFAFSGLAPQGYLALGNDRLVVAGGRSLPGLFNRHSGELIYYNAQAKPQGGYAVMTDEKYCYNHGYRYSLETGRSAGAGKSDNEYANLLQEKTAALQEELDSPAFISLVADGKLFISSKAGSIYCFGADQQSEAITYDWQPEKLETLKNEDFLLAESLLQKFACQAGWALIPGGAGEGFLNALLLNSKLNLVVLEPDGERRQQLRSKYSRAGYHGERIAFLAKSLKETQYPEYITSLLLVPDPQRAGLKKEDSDLELVYKLLRPYYGKAWINFRQPDETPKRPRGLLSWLTRWRQRGKAADESSLEFTFADGSLQQEGEALILAKRQAPIGSGQWTHQHANASQNVLSDDELVKPPFAPIWFGTTPNYHALPRHHYGPRPQVAGGRLTILGVETLSGRCVYTGRELWVREFPGIGHAFTSLELEAKWAAGESVYMINEPGATYIGSPFVTMPDSVYLRYRGEVYRLNPETGETLAKWKLQAQKEYEENEENPDWGHISVQGSYLIVTTDPYVFLEGRLGKLANGWDGSASRRLIVMDRYNGEVLWHRDADIGFRHNAICSSEDRLFVNDMLSAGALDLAMRRGMPIKQRPQLYALRLDSGEQLWRKESEVFGTFLSYSRKYDILLEGGTRDGRRHLKDEPSDRLLARNATSGEILWERKESYSGPLIIHDDMVIAGRPGPALCVTSGENKTRLHPLTDEEIAWRYWKSYGCGSSNASTHLLLFRSGAAGFADLEHDGGTGNLGGFKSGCTASMIAADGILNAPDYTRTCTCSYQNQTSLGLVHRPEMELWTSNQPIQNYKGPLRRLGVNLGAPGDGAPTTAHCGCTAPAWHPRLKSICCSSAGRSRQAHASSPHREEPHREKPNTAWTPTWTAPGPSWTSAAAASLIMNHCL